jgi:hypothetical protein
MEDSAGRAGYTVVGAPRQSKYGGLSATANLGYENYSWLLLFFLFLALQSRRKECLPLNH